MVSSTSDLERKGEAVQSLDVPKEGQDKPCVNNVYLENPGKAHHKSKLT